jgi:aminomuconate-semialdehyde/2-hydroxymuconate-6-semialdehyde dehydrogenase
LAIADRIDARLDELALAETTDGGKPLRRSRTVEIPRAAANFRFFAAAAQTFHSEAYRTDNLALNYTLRQPRGVAGLLSPWNLPLYLFTWKVAPALATGNTVVAKPSELTPTTAHLLTEICQEVGLPPGVFNVVHGYGHKAGAALVAHPSVPTISFTGGTAVGAEIAKAAAPLFKKLTLELGGKNPNIMFADADLDEVLQTSVRSAFDNQGEICLCGSRIFVEEPLYASFVERFTEATRRLKVGDPLDPATDQGALICDRHLDRVMSYIKLAREEGGRVLCGGGPPPAAAIGERCKSGAFLEPTVIVDLAPGCRVNQEEIFGPVVTISPFKSEEEVVYHANSAPFGLSASLWTRDLGRAHRLAERLECGTVWVNCWLLRDLRTPFGGVKQSGLGREGGDEAMRFFTEPKTVCIKYDT